MTILPDIEPGVQWVLAICLGLGWLITAVSKAIERIVTSRAVATRSRRDADLAEARYRDEHLSLMMDTARRDHRWAELINRDERRHDP